MTFEGSSRGTGEKTFPPKRSAREPRWSTDRESPAEASTLRVLVLTAAVGEGHLAASRALVAELAAESPRSEVVVQDMLSPISWFLRTILRDLYRMSLRWSPWGYGLLYLVFTRFRPLRALGRAGLVLLGGRSLLRLVRAHEPDVVVSTYPTATTVLGHLRRRGRLDVPVYATITDLAGVAFWAHRGVDLHLVMHDCCIAPVEREAGPGSVRLVYPLVAPSFFEPLPRAKARRQLGLPQEGSVIVVSGGGWGVGNLEGAVRAALALAGATVVALAGRNEVRQRQLEALFRAEERVLVLGFTAQMNALLAAADVLVHSTGGVTCLEALVRGCPIVVYGAPPGHARLIARAMALLGLAEAAEAPAELIAALGRALGRPASARPALPPAPSAASLILAARPRVGPLPTRRPLLVRAAVAATGVILLGGWSFSSDDAYLLVARTLDLRPLTGVGTGRPDVGLVIRAPEGLIPSIATELGKKHARASFALASAAERTLATLRHAGDEPLPWLGSGAPTDWLDTRDRLKHEARALGLSRPFFYLVPRSGLTLGQYVLARTMGALPVAGAVSLGPGSHVTQRSPRAGQVVVLTLDSGPSALQALDELLATLAQQRLSAVPLGELLASAPLNVAAAREMRRQGLAPGQP